MHDARRLSLVPPILVLPQPACNDGDNSAGFNTFPSLSEYGVWIHHDDVRGHKHGPEPLVHDTQVWRGCSCTENDKGMCMCEYSLTTRGGCSTTHWLRALEHGQCR